MTCLNCDFSLHRPSEAGERGSYLPSPEAPQHRWVSVSKRGQRWNLWFCLLLMLAGYNSHLECTNTGTLSHLIHFTLFLVLGTCKREFKNRDTLFIGMKAHIMVASKAELGLGFTLKEIKVCFKDIFWVDNCCAAGSVTVVPGDHLGNWKLNSVYRNYRD